MTKGNNLGRCINDGMLLSNNIYTICATWRDDTGVW